MYTSARIDINPLIENIVNAAQPFAHSKDVQLMFGLPDDECLIAHSPEIIGTSLFTLLCRILIYLPGRSCIKVSLRQDKDEVKIIIENSGINLSRINEITRNIPLPVDIIGEQNNRTIYLFNIRNEKDAVNENNCTPQFNATSRMSVNGFYAEIKKRLQSHYNSADKLVLLTKVYNPAEAAFLQKVNDIIFSNINDETFDANKLSSEICLSRTQLFRKLKNIIGQSPADYIRQLRLQKAKKLLETTGKRVGEVACETGFESMSHFTKVFVKRYGFKPSELKGKSHATNEQNNAT